MKKKNIMLGIVVCVTAIAAIATGVMLHAGKKNVDNSESGRNDEAESETVSQGEYSSEFDRNDNTVSNDAILESENNIEEKNAELSSKQEYVENNFYISEIPDDIFAKMQGKSYKDNCTVPREDLRYIHVLHKDFDGNTKEGELIVNRIIAEDVLEIFRELYDASYPIEKIRLVDEYNADDESSMSDNNSSAFNFRYISYTTTVSKHGLGFAVDINTLYNPYVKTVNGELSIEPANAGAYVDRDADFEHKIDHDDLCYQIFTKHGFEWGGDWSSSKDYQHFEMPDSVVEEYEAGR